VAKFSEQADVATPIDHTFDYVTDQNAVAEWNDHVQSVDVIGGGQVGIGSKLVQHRRRGDREFDLNFTVIAHEPPHRHIVTGQVFGVDTTMAFTFAEHESGTRVTMTASVIGRGVRRLLAPVVAREMHKSTVSALAALEERLGRAG
jgi:uncharacterized protein YndB with AHSA1/START domain